MGYGPEGDVVGFGVIECLMTSGRSCFHNMQYCHVICYHFCSWICFPELTCSAASRFIVAFPFPLWPHGRSASIEEPLCVKSALAVGIQMEDLVVQHLQSLCCSQGGSCTQTLSVGGIQSAVRWVQSQSSGSPDCSVLSCGGDGFRLLGQHPSSLVCSPGRLSSPFPVAYPPSAPSISTSDVGGVSTPLLAPSASTAALCQTERSFSGTSDVSPVLGFWMLKQYILNARELENKDKTHCPSNQRCCWLVSKNPSDSFVLCSLPFVTQIDVYVF